MDYVYLISGLFLLFFGGNYLVKGSVEIASHLKISTLVVGVTVVSFATSSPELAVSLRAALNNQSDISIGNVVGSNIANIALVLGITALIFPVPVHKNTIRFDWPFMMFASLLFYLFVINFKLQIFEGLFFIILLVGYNVWIIKHSRKSVKCNGEIVKKPEISPFLAVLYIALSTLGLIYGARFLSDGATGIARSFGVSERVISVSLIAVGTSIPELVTSIIAAFKKEMDISLGNIIGSNTFNLLGILGLSSIFKPLDVNVLTVRFDVLVMLGIAVILFIFMQFFKTKKITRLEGFIFLLIYFSYIMLIYNKL